MKTGNVNREEYTYRKLESLEADIADLKAHGVGLISSRANTVEKARRELEICRRTGMKLHIHLPEITENQALVEKAGLEPERAVMIGGVYTGKAIDRHLFAFSPGEHKIIIEPPVYNQGYAYSYKGEKIAHYFPRMAAPFKAEIVVPLEEFDGRQHLKIIEAKITKAPAGSVCQNDSIEGLPETSESRNRKLWRISFDLTGLDGAMLDKVGIAVYWRYGGYPHYWMFGNGNVSAWAESTREALRVEVRKELTKWSSANGGEFPSDVVMAVRFGDECFHISGHLNGPACGYPLWDYSESGIAAFRDAAGDIDYPRTWGFPEVYGAQAYGWWMYKLHEGCAQLCGVIREEIAKAAPGLMVFRNTSRMGIFDLHNDRDGSGQELLARNLDIIHVDPYPVGAGGYKNVIPRDMAYCSGLARRYYKPLVPWMQSHTYAPGGLLDISAEQVHRMAAEQYVHGVDAVMWLGYGKGYTFPLKVPQAWERAGVFHEKLRNSPPAEPEPVMAVLRPYETWAVSSKSNGKIRNPADWMMQQLLEVWAVKHGRAYDVYELAPELSREQRRKLESQLKKYEVVVSTQSWPGAWIIGEGTRGRAVSQSQAGELRRKFEDQLRDKRMIK